MSIDKRKSYVNVNVNLKAKVQKTKKVLAQVIAKYTKNRIDILKKKSIKFNYNQGRKLTKKLFKACDEN